SGTSTRYGNGGLLRTALLHCPAKSHDKLIYKVRTEYIRVGERSKTIFALNHGWEARNVSPAGSRIACKVIREIVVRPKKTRRPFAFLRLNKIAIGHKLVFRERTSSTDALASICILRGGDQEASPAHRGVKQRDSLRADVRTVGSHSWTECARLSGKSR